LTLVRPLCGSIIPRIRCTAAIGTKTKFVSYSLILLS